MSEPRIYHHLCGHQLRDWYTVEILDDGDSKHVTFTSTIHMTKRVKNTWCYSSKDYTDEEVLRDGNLGARMVEIYGRDIYVGSIRI